MEKQNLNISIDARFDERILGQSNEDSVPNWFSEQFMNENYKTIGGESQKEVRTRMLEGLLEALKNNKGKKIAIFSHGIAISFLLQEWCKITNITSNKEITMKFNNRIIYNQRLNSPEVFKLVFNENNAPISIKHIPFKNLEYEDFHLYETK